MSQLAQRLIMAAGGAKKDSTYVDDVFSTSLYRGNNKSITVGNNLKLSDANAGFGVEFHSGDTDGIVTSGSDDFAFGTGDFTVEHWIYTDFAGTQQIIDARDYGASGDSNWSTSITSSNEYRLFAVEPGQGAAIRITNNTTLNTNTWYHIAIVRSSGTTKMYIDGVQQTQTWADANNYNNTTYTLGVHGPNQSSFPFNGKLSNVRLVKGTAVYTSNFTTPIKELKNIAGTELLCCQSSASPSLATVNTSNLLTLVNTPVVSYGPFTGSDAKGGLVWIKNRDTNGYGHFLFDTKRGTTNAICSNLTNTQFTEAKGVNSFNSGGFTLGGSGGDAAFNSNNVDYASWTYAIQEGFFDIQTWDGNNTAGRQLPHNLGSVPGCIMVKSTDGGSGDWMVYHREIGATHRIKLNSSTSSNTTASWNDVVPTSTYVELGSNTGVNASGRSYVGYFFAGGASTAATARSVYFQAGAEYLESSSSDYVLGTGDFTVELWFKTNDHGAIQRLFDKRTASNTSGGVLSIWQEHLYWHIDGSNGPIIGLGNCKIRRGQWYHAAVVRHSSTTKLYLNGEDVGTLSNDTTNYDTSAVRLGEAYNGGYGLNGNISNFRIVVGTALYTSSFKPPTEPLTSITNTKLLCCNNSSVTGKTTGATITVSGNVTASSDAPFDDSEGFKFGAGEDQNLIKTGSYVGNQNADGPEVYLGWEPQFIILKPTSGSENWGMWDSMRGIVTGGNDMRLLPNTTHEELTNFDGLSLTPTGFKITSSNHLINPDGTGVVYIAIRRPDAFVGKPPAVGTDAFAMETGNSSSAGPSFDANFDVDFSLLQQPWSGGTDWRAFSRSTSLRSLATNTPNAEVSETNNTSDYNNGIGHSYTAVWQSWMWKRHAGFDVITYAGISATRSIPHNMGIAPEMMWIKSRTSGSQEWRVYHKGLNGGTNPEEYRMNLNDSGGESNIGAGGYWDVPTNTHITLHSNGSINFNSNDFIAYLFASVEGISKVDFWIGDGTNNRQITLGFQPRFLLVTLANQGGGYGWQMMDSWRGFISPNNNILRLNNNNANSNQPTYFTPNATGFTITESAFNGSSQNWIYYAHA